VVGKGATFRPVLEDKLKAKVRRTPLCCPGGHRLEKLNWMDRCVACCREDATEC
jgi:hypothetical protein